MFSKKNNASLLLVAASSRGGYQTRYWMPPMAVMLVGALMMTLNLGFINKITPLEKESDKQINKLSSLFMPEVHFWSEKIIGWAAEAGLDPNLVATVMQIESCGDPRAVSTAGALGLFQVMPYHFTSNDNPFDPDTNALRGLDYLKRSFETAHGDSRLTLAGYNGGIGVIQWPESDWAMETQRYVYWGSGIFNDASSGLTNSQRLQEWLFTNGDYLCRQAHDRLGINP